MFETIFEKTKSYLLENKVVTALLAIIIALLATGSFLLISPSQAEEPQQLLVSSAISQIPSSPQEQQEPAESQAASGKILVDVKGAVTSEGVYELAAGSRVTDAIQLAGGFSEQADKKSVNLAAKLADEEVIYVARQGENVSAVASNTAPATGQTTATGTSEKINLNTATLADLQTISGIGAKRAQDILDYRDANGGFTSIDELTKVSGIGDKTLEKLKDEVTLD